MRIIELAQQLKTTPRELLLQAEALGVEARTSLSRIDEEDASQLTEGFRKRASVEIADEESRVRERIASKKAAAEQLRQQDMGDEAEALRAAIQRALEIERAVKGLSGEAQEPSAGPSTEPGDPVSQGDASEPQDQAPAPAPEEKAEEEAQSESGLPEEAPELPVAAKAPGSAKLKRPPRPFHPEEDEEDLLHSSGKRNAASAGEMPPARPGKKSSGKTEYADRSRRSQPVSARTDASSGASTVPAEPSSVSEGDPDSKVLYFKGAVVIKDLAAKLGMRPNVVITELMKRGILASINQSVDVATATQIAEAHGFTVEQDRSRRSAENRPALRRVDADDSIPDDSPETLKPRPPVVTFLGHVDHGKTSLMDRIRATSVASGESGGITQHIGAYTVETNGHTITFLDTPGHAAFSAMRARGANLTDIAVIIVAADDGIMPQTREAIKHARDADVALMVAINKCDLPQARPDRVMQQLQAENLTPEEWGGDVVVCPVSAHTGDGIDHLLEMILLQAEVLELRSNPSRRANGTVIEAQMEPGRGPTASVLVTGGTLCVGDAVLCGEHFGRLRAILNAQGHLVRAAGPSSAVRIMGLSGVPEAGSEFRVMPNEKRAKQLAEEFSRQKKTDLLGVTQARSVDDIFRKIHDAGKLELRVILRADVQGSVEAIEESIGSIQSEKVGCTVIQSGTGNITTNDVQRAGSGSALILGFHVSPEPGVAAEARHYGVRIKTFRIIYELLDFIKQEMLNLLPVEHREVVRGHALVKQVFSLSRKGNVAGCVVQDGVMLLAGKARVLRKQQALYTGAFSSIRHFQDEVKEMSAAQECGLRFVNFEDYQEGDIIECFVLEEIPKTI